MHTLNPHYAPPPPFPLQNEAEAAHAQALSTLREQVADSERGLAADTQRAEQLLGAYDTKVDEGKALKATLSELEAEVRLGPVLLHTCARRLILTFTYHISLAAAPTHGGRRADARRGGGRGGQAPGGTCRGACRRREAARAEHPRSGEAAGAGSWSPAASILPCSLGEGRAGMGF